MRPAGSRLGARLAALMLSAATAAAGACAEADAFPGQSPEARPEASVAASPGWSDADWEVFQEKAAGALASGLDRRSLGETVAAVGRSFVGTPYAPGTLEAPGPEHLVINFQALDCVTFVENAFALARFVHLPDAAVLLRDRGRAEDAYEALLTEIRYRGGNLDGYPSRLHYFSEWIGDGEAKGLVRDVTGELGGVPIRERVDFMSRHLDAYGALAEAANLAAVRETEEKVSGRERRWIPEDRIEAAETGIQDGDIIAATSTLDGLDVAHTGIAIRVEGTVRLMHAPLVGDSVQISEETLAQRVRRIRGQDGIMVARATGEH